MMQLFVEDLEKAIAEELKLGADNGEDPNPKRPVNTPSKNVGPSPNQAPYKKCRGEPEMSPFKPMRLALTPSSEKRPTSSKAAVGALGEDSQVFPIADSQVFPIADSQDFPVADSQDFPVADGQDFPVADSQDFPVADSQDLSLAIVDHTRKPTVDSLQLPDTYEVGTDVYGDVDPVAVNKLAYTIDLIPESPDRLCDDGDIASVLTEVG